VKKIAFFILSYGNFGGAERRMSYLINNWIDKYDVKLFTTDDFYEFLLLNHPLQNNKSIEAIADNCGFSFIYKCKILIHFYFFIKKNSIKHIHFPVDPNFFSFIVSFKFLMPSDFSYSCSIVNSIKKNKLSFGFIEYYYWKRTLQNARFLTALSPSIHKNILTLFPDTIIRNKSHIAPCSFSPILENSAFKKLQYSDYSCRIYDVCFVGRFVKGKGIDLLAEIIRELINQKPNVRIGLMGFGPLREKFNERMFGVNCDNVYYKDSNDSALLMSNSRILLSLQEFENYPSQVIYEAAVNGCLVLATDVGDTRMFLNENNSVLLPCEADVFVQSIFEKINDPYSGFVLASQLYNDLKKNHSFGKYSNWLHQLLVDEVIDE